MHGSTSLRSRRTAKRACSASWFLSRYVPPPVHSGVVGAGISPGTSVLQVPHRKTRPGDPGGTTTADGDGLAKPFRVRSVYSFELTTANRLSWP